MLSFLLSEVVASSCLTTDKLTAIVLPLRDCQPKAAKPNKSEPFLANCQQNLCRLLLKFLRFLVGLRRGASLHFRYEHWLTHAV
jgi:hypothetical protein